MRIIGKYHDYWDGALRHSANGIDKTITFVRNQDEYLTSHVKGVPLTPHFNFTNENHKNVSFGIVGFCGVYYPYAIVKTHVKIDGRYSHDIRHFYYDAEELIELLVGEKVTMQLGTTKLKDISNYWNEVPKYYSQFDLFRKCNCAYMSIVSENYRYGEREVEFYTYTHPVLRDIGFPKVKGVEQAYQDVELFITNVLAPKDNPYIAPIPDKIKAQSKGFDEFSFRKMKTKRK